MLVQLSTIKRVINETKSSNNCRKRLKWFEKELRLGWRMKRNWRQIDKWTAIGGSKERRREKVEPIVTGSGGNSADKRQPEVQPQL
jgi:hypothetical protein